MEVGDLGVDAVLEGLDLALQLRDLGSVVRFNLLTSLGLLDLVGLELVMEGSLGVAMSLLGGIGLHALGIVDALAVASCEVPDILDSWLVEGDDSAVTEHLRKVSDCHVENGVVLLALELWKRFEIISELAGDRVERLRAEPE